MVHKLLFAKLLPYFAPQAIFGFEFSKLLFPDAFLSPRVTKW